MQEKLQPNAKMKLLNYGKVAVILGRFPLVRTGRPDRYIGKKFRSLLVRFSLPNQSMHEYQTLLWWICG